MDTEAMMKFPNRLHVSNILKINFQLQLLKHFI